MKQRFSILHKHLIGLICLYAFFLVVFGVPENVHSQDSLVLNHSGYVGIGIENPERQLHLQGANATFRMDRDRNTAAFILVRTDSANNPLKTFVVGTNASGPNNGEFIINDLGDQVGGSGSRRLTITNSGVAHFTGSVHASEFLATSSVRYKQDIETFSEAGQFLNKLRGVRFNWKDTGRASLGLVAEEVAEVLPDLVAFDDESGEVEGINYAALTAVLVEALKEQQVRLDALENKLMAYQELAMSDCAVGFAYFKESGLNFKPQIGMHADSGD